MLQYFHVIKSKKNFIINAFVISTKKAPTRGSTKNAFGEAPNFSVTAVIFAIAVGVAPNPKPANPADITAAS